jgi:hypothetical protein
MTTPTEQVKPTELRCRHCGSRYAPDFAHRCTPTALKITIERAQATIDSLQQRLTASREALDGLVAGLRTQDKDGNPCTRVQLTPDELLTLLRIPAALKDQPHE